MTGSEGLWGEAVLTQGASELSADGTIGPVSRRRSFLLGGTGLRW